MTWPATEGFMAEGALGTSRMTRERRRQSCDRCPCDPARRLRAYTVELVRSGRGTFGECRTAADCVLVSDCCACRAEPKGAQVASCLATCAIDACAANQIEAHEVTCAFDRCVLARSCDTTRVTCLADPAQCPPGTILSERDGCWGPCLPPTECSRVAACSSCGAGSVCVRQQVTAGYVIGCVTPAPDCRAGNYCGCIEACPGACAEADAGVECICGGC
jgi:hypothetical protein